MIVKTAINGSPHIGLFCVANDEVALLPLFCPQRLEKQVEEALDVDVVKVSMADTGLLGIFSAVNNEKIIVSDLLYKDEIHSLEEIFGEVIVLEDAFTAIGNLVAMNDKGIACSTYIAPLLEEYGCKGLKVAGSDLIGSVVFANNKGFLAHRDSSEKELKDLEKILKVKGDVGTVNFGDPFVKSGLVGNTKGILVGNLTSGPELNRIDDIFMLE